ncbi:MAG TPA: thioredoxin family protein, partial [Bradyrhizobium sp.]
PIIDSLAEQSANKDLVIFSVDFDGQKPIVRKFRAQSQSTLIAFRGKTETARSVGDTDPSSIAALVQSTSAK